MRGQVRVAIEVVGRNRPAGVRPITAGRRDAAISTRRRCAAPIGTRSSTVLTCGVHNRPNTSNRSASEASPISSRNPVKSGIFSVLFEHPPDL